jgi:hypothetical protein
VAVVAGGRVVACSRAAWSAGVRPGLAGPAAHAVDPALLAVPAQPLAEKAALEALGEALGALTEVVDLGGAPAGSHHAVYVAVPPRTRGVAFGARLLAVAAAQGLRARVGIADDRFTAWVAASTGEGEARVVSVPRGGSAAFLAPRPVSLLAIPPEVQHVLAAVGVHTLGELAALPPPTTAHAPAWDADYQALARGDGWAGLAAWTPGGPIVERVQVGGAIGVGAALALAARRVAGRLAGRGRAAVTLIVRAGDGAQGLPLPLPAPTADERDLADAAGPLLGSAPAVVELEVARAVEIASGGEADGTCVPAAARAGETPEPAAQAVPAAVVAEESVPVTAPPAVFCLTPPEAPRLGPREPHRRTRRGKQRSRAAVLAQSRLFAM